MKENLGIGEAVSCMRILGHRVARKGWNGKGMFIVFQPGYSIGVDDPSSIVVASRHTDGTVCKFCPYIMMKTVTGEFIPWLCSQADLLAEDYVDLDG